MAFCLQDEVGDWGTEQQWPWFRQPDTSPGPHKRANPADFIDVRGTPSAIKAFALDSTALKGVRLSFPK